MRTLKNLPVPQDGDNVKFPDGQIRNETITETGTPVVRELYGDVLTNIYKIIRDAGIVFTETEDSSTSQYQLLDALRVFANRTNDLQQILTVSPGKIDTTMDFSNFPSNYVFIGKLTDALLATSSYDIRNGVTNYPVNPIANIAASSIVLIILNAAGSVILDLTSAGGASVANFVNTNIGNPLSFNSSETLYYLSNGIVLTDTPTAFKVEEIIQGSLATSDVIIVDALVFKGKLICFTLNTVTLKYQAFSFAITDLNTLEGEIVIPDLSGSDNQPYMFCDGVHLYFTNSTAIINGTVDNYAIGKFNFDEIGLIISSVSFFEVDTNYQKTTNIFIDSATQKLYTFISGSLTSYTFDGNAGVEAVFLDSVNGQVFKFNGNTFYSNGELASKWNY